MNTNIAPGQVWTDGKIQIRVGTVIKGERLTGKNVLTGKGFEAGLLWFIEKFHKI